MSGDRYEISEGELDVLAITGPEGTRYIDGAEIEARAIRQQARDIDSRDAVIAACAEAVGASVSPGCSDEFRAMLPAEIRAQLAAVIAERDELRTERQELLAKRFDLQIERDDARKEAANYKEAGMGLDRALNAIEQERDRLRNRLAAIDNAPTVAWASADLRSVFVDDELAAKCTDVRDLIARPARG